MTSDEARQTKPPRYELEHNIMLKIYFRHQENAVVKIDEAPLREASINNLQREPLIGTLFSVTTFASTCRILNFDWSI